MEDIVSPKQLYKPMSKQIIITEGLRVAKRVTIHKGRYGIIENIKEIDNSFDMRVFDENNTFLKLYKKNPLDEFIELIEKEIFITLSEV